MSVQVLFWPQLDVSSIIGKAEIKLSDIYKLDPD